MGPITLSGFDAKSAENDDPSRTFDDRDEALRRRAILHATGPGRRAGCSRSPPVTDRTAPRSPRGRFASTRSRPRRAGRSWLHAPSPRARSGWRCRRPSPVRPTTSPSSPNCYTISPRATWYGARGTRRRRYATAARWCWRTTASTPDLAQHAAHIQRRFLAGTGRRWQLRTVRRTSHWFVLSCRLRDGS
jgi:hypothetical protein